MSNDANEDEKGSKQDVESYFKHLKEEVEAETHHIHDALIAFAHHHDIMKEVKDSTRDAALNLAKEPGEALLAYLKLGAKYQYEALRRAIGLIYAKEIQAMIKEREEEEEEKCKADSDPSITEYVVNALQAAIKNKSIHVKAVGADRAFTTITEPSGSNDDGIKLEISCKGYKNPDCKDLLNDKNGSFSASLLSAAAQKTLSTNNIALIESGSYVGTIEDYWWPPDPAESGKQKHYHSKHRSSLYDKDGNIYKCLPNRGGYENLSLVGLSSVGAMGYSNGHNIGGIQSAILSLRLLTVEDGKIKHYQIEPSVECGGIFDPNSKAKLAALGVELIQDTQTFSDVLVSMGTYGVITHCYIALMDACWLKVHREYVKFDRNQQPWIDKYNEIANRKDVYQFQVWFQPYSIHRIMVVTYFTKLPNDPKLKPNTAKEIRCDGGANRNYTKMPAEQMILTGAAVQCISNWTSHKKIPIKDAIGIIGTFLNIGLMVLSFKENTDPNTHKKCHTLTMSCVEALDFGTANNVPTNTSGNSFDIDKTVEATTAYIKFLNKIGHDRHLLLTSPVALRFSKQSYGSVSCAGEGDVGWIEQPVVTVGVKWKAAPKFYKTAYENSKILLGATRQFFDEQCQSKIHWGLWFDIDDKDGKDKWWRNISDTNKQSFFANYVRFNKDKVFSNIFTQNSGMDAVEILYPRGSTNNTAETVVELAPISHVPRSNDADIDESSETAQFKEAIRQLAEEKKESKKASDFKYGDKTVNCFRQTFQVLLIWFCLLLLSWDLTIPIATIKTALWTSADQVDCDECSDACMQFGNQTYLESCKPKERPFGDTPIWFNPQFRQEFGDYWWVLVTIHVMGQWSAFICYIFQLFFTKYGSKAHKKCGAFILLFVMIGWSFGAIAAVLLVGDRGFHPCAYSITGYNNPNPYYTNPGQDTQSSFPFYLYLLFCYDGAVLNECLMYGIASRVLISVAFDPIYDYITKPNTILKRWHAYALSFLSWSSLWLYIWRTMTLFVILVFYAMTDDTKIQKIVNVKSPELVANQCTFDEQTFDYPNVTVPLDSITDIKYVTSSMCITNGADNLAGSDIKYVSSVMVLFIAQLLLIPMIQIPNIKFAKSFMERMKICDAIKTWTDVEEIKNEINGVLSDSAQIHGRNLTVAGFVVFWTGIANIGFVFVEALMATSYVIGYLLLLMYWFCVCQVVQQCPSPYDKCCEWGCCNVKCCGLRSLKEICRCFVPPDHKKGESVENVIQSRFPVVIEKNNSRLI